MNNPQNSQTPHIIRKEFGNAPTLTMLRNILKDYYTKEQVDEIISHIVPSGGKIPTEYVDELPEPSLQTEGKLYLVPIDDGETGSDPVQQLYDMFLTVRKNDVYRWNPLGNSDDWDNYYTKQQIDSRIDTLNIKVGALLTKNMLDVKNNWSGAVGGEVEYSEDIPDTITAFDQLYSPVIRIGYGVPMCYSFYSDEELGDSVIAFYGTDEPESARDYSDMSRPHTVLQFTRLDNDTYNDNTQKYRYFVAFTSPFDGYLVLQHSKDNDNYTVICPMLEAGRTPTEYSADMTEYINAHLTSTQKTIAQRNIGLEKGTVNGVASLNEQGIVPQEQTLAIRFNEQLLTDSQKSQALNNIDGKSYNPVVFSGLGKKILVKNIQLVDDVQQNVMTQAFFDDDQDNHLTNTVFVIKYDYTLIEDIELGVGCTLEFDGGSISGSYTITGNKTRISAPLTQIFDTNIVIAGSWNVSAAYPEWFGAKGDEVTDDTIPFQKALDYFADVKAPNIYLVSEIELYYGKTLTNFREIRGNIRITHSRNLLVLNRLWGSITIKSSSNSSCSNNEIRFRTIYVPENGAGIILDGSEYGVQNTFVFGGQTTNWNNDTSKPYNYGVWMKARQTGDLRSFCNQNIFYNLVTFNAAVAGIFMDNTSTDGYSDARMNGNMTYCFDPEASACGIIMGVHCQRNIFYGVRNNEFFKSNNPLLRMGADCISNQIHLTTPFTPQMFRATGDSNILVYGNFTTTTWGRFWDISKVVGRSDGSIIVIPLEELPNKLKVLDANVAVDNTAPRLQTVIGYTIFSGHYVVVLDSSYGYERRGIKALAAAGELPPVFITSLPDYNCHAYLLGKSYTVTTDSQEYLLDDVTMTGTNTNIYVKIGTVQRTSGTPLRFRVDLMDNDSVLRSLTLYAETVNNINISNNVTKVKIYITQSAEGSEYTIDSIILATNVGEYIELESAPVAEKTLYDISFIDSSNTKMITKSICS